MEGQALIVETEVTPPNNQAMVERKKPEPDPAKQALLREQQQRIAANFATALSEPKAPTPGEIAVRCGVTEQAVSGWKRTGKIALEHLLVVSELTGWSVHKLVTGKEAPHSRAVDFNGRHVTNSDWDTLQDINALPHDQQAKERQRLFEQAQVFREYAAEVIKKTREGNSS